MVKRSLKQYIGFCLSSMKSILNLFFLDFEVRIISGFALECSLYRSKISWKTIFLLKMLVYQLQKISYEHKFWKNAIERIKLFNCRPSTGLVTGFSALRKSIPPIFVRRRLSFVCSINHVQFRAVTLLTSPLLSMYLTRCLPHAQISAGKGFDLRFYEIETISRGRYLDLESRRFMF